MNTNSFSKNLSKKVAFYGVFASLAMVMAVIERMFPIPIPVQGVKLGLANVIVIIVLYAYNARSAFAINMLRITIVGLLLFGNMTSFGISLAGGLLSFVAMVFAKKIGIFGLVGVSVLGGVAHNLGQIAVAALILQNAYLIPAYTPILLVSGVITGVIIGFTAGFTLNNLKVIRRMGGGF